MATNPSINSGLARPSNVRAAKIFPDVVQCLKLREAGFQGTTNFAWCVMGGDLRTAFLVNTEVRKDEGHYQFIPAPTTDELLAAILDRREDYQKCAFIDRSAKGYEVGLHQSNCPALSLDCDCVIDGFVDAFLFLANETPADEGVPDVSELYFNSVPNAPKDVPKNYFVGVSSFAKATEDTK